MKEASLESAIPEHARILLDTSVLLAYLNGGEVVTPLAVQIIDDYVKNGRNQALVSAVTAMEILVRPIQAGGTAEQVALNFLTYTDHLQVVDVDIHTARQAARLRAAQGYTPPDALVIASSIVYQVHTLVTNDAKWRTLNASIASVCYLNDVLPPA